MNSGKDLSRKEGKGRGKFSAKLLASLPEPGICLKPTEKSPHLPVTKVQESPPALTQSSVPNQTTNNSRRVIESRTHGGEENCRRTFREPGDPYEHINVKVLPGVGMKDVDPAYRRLLDRNINNVSDPDNEDWGE